MYKKGEWIWINKLLLFWHFLVSSSFYRFIILCYRPSQNEKTVTQTQTTIEQLQEQLNQKREDIIEKNNEIIAKESSTSDSINKALATISETKNIGEKEKSIVAKVKELGYQDAYVEIENQTIKITVLKKDAKASDASKVIKEVLKLVGDDYQVEVKFINE